MVVQFKTIKSLSEKRRIQGNPDTFLQGGFLFALLSSNTYDLSGDTDGRVYCNLSMATYDTFLAILKKDIDHFVTVRGSASLDIWDQTLQSTWPKVELSECLLASLKKPDLTHVETSDSHQPPARAANASRNTNEDYDITQLPVSPKEAIDEPKTEGRGLTNITAMAENRMVEVAAPVASSSRPPTTRTSLAVEIAKVRVPLAVVTPVVQNSSRVWRQKIHHQVDSDSSKEIHVSPSKNGSLVANLLTLHTT
ncbi:hypothetical protein C8J56DRAFT_880545 [Mycena floridula]|nr:hypothetical protein C8J56DRAFT_880545 [Mycena floridula]